MATAPAGAWLAALRRYLLATAGLNLVWEVTQLPLYTLWREGSVGEIAFAVAHCTAGDMLIAAASLVLALLLLGDRRWPAAVFGRVASCTVALGAGYTVFSEWLNTEVRGSWAYSDLMPVVPILGTGLSPLAQWIVVPLAALAWAHRGAASHQPGIATS